VAILRADVNAEFAAELAKLRAKLTEGDESWDELSKATDEKGRTRQTLVRESCLLDARHGEVVEAALVGPRHARKPRACAGTQGVRHAHTASHRAIAQALGRAQSRSGTEPQRAGLAAIPRVERALRREPQSAASQRALATQAYRSAELRGAGARKAAQTKGAAGWSRAAKKAAQTRARRLA
jgi:hypothetical protein